MTPEQAREVYEQAVLTARAAVGMLDVLEARLPASQRGRWELRRLTPREIELDTLPEVE